jgi:eukaryotic-like serine/threonine-protein kinase
MSERSRWAEIEAVCQAALDRRPDERREFVASECGDDEDLRRDVEALLEHAESDDALLESPLAALAAYALGADESALCGSRVGSLEIGAVIGRGGMGEVYRARDTRLERDVAIKVLPTVFATDPDRLARFKREAVILASLNHANIAAIFGVEDLGDAQALVLELVEGPTLEERLREQALGLEDTISIARQIAEALEAAHERGIVHRDLKPANIKLRSDGVVKVLDFGLATAFDPAIAQPARTSDTYSNAAKVSGVLGTPRYMSPEQRAGQVTDKRVDIWAFGAVLYEMLAGQPPSVAQTRAEAGATPAEIDWSKLDPATPDAVQRLIARCLERHPRQRLRDIGEARVVLEGISHDPPPLRRSRRHSRRLMAPAVAALLTAIVTAAATWWVMRPAVPPVTRFTLATEADTALFVDPQSEDLAISPDGRRIVYKGGRSGEHTRLFVRGLDRLESIPITAPGIPKAPFVSPDGRWVGYFVPGDPITLKRVAISGGPTQTLARLQGPSRGASWGSDGTIVAATALESSGLIRVSDNGGDPQVITVPDTQRGERDHLWPHHLPDGKSILFTVTSTTGGREATSVAVLDLESGSWRPVLRGASQAKYLQSGHLLYVAGEALWMVPFDVSRRQTTGAARVVVPHILILPTGTAEFAVAPDGTLAYVADTAAPTRRRIVWVDRNGREQEITDAPPRVYAAPRLSPDGSRIAVEIGDGDHDIWVWDIHRRALTQVTAGPAIDQAPLWSVDGKRLFFTSTGGGILGRLFWQAADGSGGAEPLTESRNVRRPTAVLAHNGGVIYSEGSNLMLLTLKPPRSPAPILHTTGLEQFGVVSPDGRWIAFDSSDSGSSQVFVRPFPNVNDARFQISRDGGGQPRWSRDGRELFFLAADGTIMGADVVRGPTWQASTPRPIVPRNVLADVSISLRTFDVTPDGQRFLVLKGSPDRAAAPPQVVVVQNWLDEINRADRAR